MQIPHGFQPMTLEKMLYHFAGLAPTLGPKLFRHMELPEQEVAAKVVSLEARGLVQFAVAPNGEPSVFTATPTAAWEPGEHLFADRLVSFWDTTGKFDDRNGTIVRPELPPMVFTVRTPEGDMTVVASVALKLRDMGLLTEDENGDMHGPSKTQVMDWTLKHGICDFCSDTHPIHVEQVRDFSLVRGTVDPTSVGGWATCETCHTMIAENRRKDLLTRAIGASSGGKLTVTALRGMHQRFWEAMDEARAPRVPQLVLPHWQVALDQKINAINQLKVIERLPKSHPRFQEILWMDMAEDLAALRVAEVYSFNADTMHAIMVGAQSIPHESTLKSVEIPNVRAGWFWFAEPFPAAPSPVASDYTAALLWSWSTTAKQPTINFSAYVRDDKRIAETGKILPSAKWVWPIDLSYHEMIGLNTLIYRNAYGPEGPYKDQQDRIGEQQTMAVVAELSIFFMMACLWFRQTVPGTKRKIEAKLTQTPGHIERHARKRAQKELKLNEAPTVRVVALRKTAVTEQTEPRTEATRHLKVRFVVSGHARLQPCGPARKDKKLIWIDAYPKGPEDAPFKDGGPRVFAVVR